MEKYNITELRQGVKNPNRVNVFVDGKYAFSLDVTQVVDMGVKAGQKITEEELAELKKASDFGKLYQRTLEWILIRPRSVRETKDYLVRKQASEFSKIIIQQLSERGYLDDRKFAEWYVENRFVKKGVSQRRLKMELIKKGIAREIIENVLDRRDDEEELRKMIDKKRTKYTPEKLIAYLVRQGFSYDLVRRLVDEIED